MKAIDLLVVAVGTLILACDGKSKQPEKPAEKPLKVKVAKAETQPIFDRAEYGATIRSAKAAPLFSKVPGTILKVHRLPGAKVRGGETLLSVRPDGLQDEFRPHLIRSPISGVLLAHSLEPGVRVSVDTVLVTVAEPSQLQTTIQVVKEDLDSLRSSSDVKFEQTGGPSMTAKVVNIAPNEDPILGTYLVLLQLVCEGSCEGKLAIGAYGRVVIEKNRRQSVLVPLHALNRGRDKIFTLSENKTVEPVSVRLGAYFGDKVEILSGLAPGLTYLTKWSKQPKKGDSVVIQAEPAMDVSPTAKKSGDQDKG